ncbi:MAG: TRAP transporter substrate-binding protein [Xanthobacteraceae bacterium]
MQPKLIAGALALALFAPATAATAQTVTLNVSSWVPPSHLITADVLVPLCKDMESATQGRVKCNMLPKAVVAPPQTFDAVRDGLADLSFSAHGYTPGRFVATDIAEFPFLGDTSESISVAYQRIHDRMLTKLDEHKGLHLMGVFTHGPGQIFNTKRAVNSLKDLDGMKIRVGGGLVVDIANALGTVPMLKPAPESYELLSQGVADGVFFPKEAAMSFKLVPLLKHATYVPGGLYNVTFGMVMNPAKWKQISVEDQAAINKLSGEALARRAGKAWDATDVRGEKALRDAGVPIVTASPEFVAEIRSRTTKLEQAWAEKAKAKGLDGTAALAALRAEIVKTKN